MSKPNRKKRDFIKRVSHHTNIRADVVEMILDGIVDVAIEDIVNTGEFGLRQLFDVSAAEWGGYNIGDQKVNSHLRLKITLSSTVRDLWKARFSDFGGAVGRITKDNWREVLRGRRRGVSVTNKAIAEVDPNYNPFLDDDE